MSPISRKGPTPRLTAMLAAALIAGAGLSGLAQRSPVTAADIAKRVDGHYNRLQSLKASFTEQYDGLGMHRSESGTMMLRKPGWMRWEYASTAGKIFVLDGKYAWFYAPGESQVQRMAASQLDDLRSPLRFLLGHTKLESELTDLKLTDRDFMGGPEDKAFRVTGIPKGLQKRIAKISLAVAPDGTILEIVIEETDGARTLFDFSHEQANPAIPESAFRFTPPPGIPVVDAPPPA